jgi:hypothetical protein
MNLTLNGIEAMQETTGELTIKSQSAEDNSFCSVLRSIGPPIRKGLSSRKENFQGRMTGSRLAGLLLSAFHSRTLDTAFSPTALIRA